MKCAALTMVLLAGCITPITASKTVVFQFKTATDVALIASTGPLAGLPAGGPPQAVTLSTSRLQVRGLLTNWEAAYEVGARREEDGSIRLVWATAAPTEGGYSQTILPAEAALTLNGLPAELRVPGDFVERGSKVGLDWCSSFRDVAPSSRHGRGPSSFRQMSRLILPPRLSADHCDAHEHPDAHYSLETNSSNVARINETLHYYHDVPTWKIEVFLLGLLGTCGALTEIVATPRANSAAKGWGALSAALGLLVAGLVVPDLLVRAPPDREIVYDAGAFTATTAADH